MIKMLKKMVKKKAGKTSKKTVAKKSATKKSSASKKAIDANKKDLYPLIEEKAYQYFVERGSGHGDDQADWFKAEQEVLANIIK